MANKKRTATPAQKRAHAHRQAIYTAKKKLATLIDSTDPKKLKSKEFKEQFDKQKIALQNKILKENISLNVHRKKNNIKTRSNEIQRKAINRSGTGSIKIPFDFTNLKDFKKMSINLVQDPNIKTVNGVKTNNQLRALNEFDKQITSLNSDKEIVIEIDEETGKINVYVTLRHIEEEEPEEMDEDFEDFEDFEEDEEFIKPKKKKSENKNKNIVGKSPTKNNKRKKEKAKSSNEKILSKPKKESKKSAQESFDKWKKEKELKDWLLREQQRDLE